MANDFTETPSRHSISVVIPTYNSASTLPDAIDSVLHQTLPPDEVIVVDDGSTDETERVCRRYAGDVIYIKKENAGASAARNTGARAARGRWLAFLDADDQWDAQKLEIQISAMRQHPQAAFATTAALVWSPADRACFKLEWTGSLDPRVLRRELLVRNIFTGLCSSIVVDRNAFMSIGGFAEGKLSEDRRIAIELLARHRGLILPHALIRQQPGPASFGDPEKMRRAMLELINDYLPLYAELDPRGRLFRRARARVHERAGMHYLEKGDLRRAANDLARAAVIWPFMANPWRFFANACLGRLRRHAKKARAVAAPTKLAPSAA